MKRLFAVIRGRGPAWNKSVPLEGQDGWRTHAVFMNQLEADGFVVTGGPLEDNGDTLLIVRADTFDEVRARLAPDPWNEDMLPLVRIAAWQIRLGEQRLADPLNSVEKQNL